MSGLPLRAALCCALAVLLAALYGYGQQSRQQAQQRALADDYARHTASAMQHDLQTLLALLAVLQAANAPQERDFEQALRPLRPALARLPVEAIYRQHPAQRISLGDTAAPPAPPAPEPDLTAAAAIARRSGLPAYASNHQQGPGARLMIVVSNRQGQVLGLTLRSTDWLTQHTGRHQDWLSAALVDAGAGVTAPAHSGHDTLTHTFSDLTPALQLQWQINPAAIDGASPWPESGLILLLGLAFAWGIGRADTRRERAEAAVDQAGSAREASERRLTRALQLSRDGVWELDPGNSTLYLSERARILLGTDEARLSPRHALRLIPAMWRKEVLNKLKLASRHGEAQELRFRHEDAAGGRWLKLRARSFESQGGRLLTGSVADISEEMLQATLHERYRAMLMRVIDALPVPIALHSADQNLLMMNESYATRMLLPLQGIINKPEHRELAAHIEELGLQAITTGEPQSLQAWLPMLDGEMRYLRISRALCDGIEGEPNIVASFEDITEPHKAAQLIQAERGYFQRIIDSLPNSTYIKDAAHRYLLTNQAHARENGCTKQDILGKRSHDFTPDAAAEIETAENQLLASPVGTIAEQALRIDQNGRVRHIVIRKVRIDDANGQPALLGTNADVTTLREIEEDLRRQSERQMQLHRFLQAVFDAVPHPLFVKDSQHRYIISNRAHAESVGAASVEAVLGKRSSDFVDEDVARHIEAAEDDLFTHGNIGMMNGEFILPHKTGRTRHVVLCKALCIDAEGQSVLVGVNTDITQLREVEEGLRQHRNQLAQLLSAQTHELVRANEITEQAREARAHLLSSLHNALHPLIHDILLSTQNDRLNNIQHIHERSERLLTTLATLIKTARSEERTSPLTLRPARLEHLVQDLCAEFQSLLSAKNISLMLHAPTPLPPVQADKPLLCHALRLLLQQALNDLHADTTLQLTLAAHTQDATTTATLCLTGTGSPSPLAEQACKIIAAHQGQLHTTSPAPHILCISVSLPAASTTLFPEASTTH